MVEIKGKAGISVKVICDSISEQGVRLTTFECEYGRLCHAELLTHRMLSRNAASSRAIPHAKMLENLHGIPVSFGKNQSGMQAGEELPVATVDALKHQWEMAKLQAKFYAESMNSMGVHKQVSNRLLECFQTMKTIITSTEWDNFFWLRNDSAADPTLHELARCMQEARDKSVPQMLKAGEWHLPFVTTTRNEKDLQEFWESNYDGHIISNEEAIKVSCARCAAVSFRNEDYGLEKCLEVYARLVGGDRKHASALEHCATPMSDEYNPRSTVSTLALNVPHVSDTWQKGISHMDRNGKLWSGNLKGWVQHRKLVGGENFRH